eukprot:COSAG03_NODE_5089_length_1342_cov_3.417538_2_plen_54_part_01
MFGGIAVDCGRSCESLALDCSEIAVGQNILLLLRLANSCIHVSLKKKSYSQPNI